MYAFSSCPYFSTLSKLTETDFVELEPRFNVSSFHIIWSSLKASEIFY